MEAYAQPPAPAPADNPFAVKRPLGRTWGLSVVSFGLYSYVWFYIHRKLIDGEMGEGKDDALLHTLGLLVPVLNFFIVHWLWRDLNTLRVRVGMPEFPEIAYVVGSIFLAPVFYSLVLNELNEYWDVRTQGLATDAPITTAEKGVAIGGAVIFGLYLLFILIAIIVAVARAAV